MSYRFFLLFLLSMMPLGVGAEKNGIGVVTIYYGFKELHEHCARNHHGSLPNIDPQFESWIKKHVIRLEKSFLAIKKEADDDPKKAEMLSNLDRDMNRLWGAEWRGNEKTPMYCFSKAAATELFDEELRRIDNNE
ncbi:MAG: hypothetical protein ACPGU7_09970 [Gammaproteobacteria bacterium]